MWTSPGVVPGLANFPWNEARGPTTRAPRGCEWVVCSRTEVQRTNLKLG